MSRQAWTVEQAREVIRLHKSGLCATDVGVRTGHSKNAVLGMLRRAKAQGGSLDDWGPREPLDRLGLDAQRRAVWARARRGAAETRRQNEMLSFPR